VIIQGEVIQKSAAHEKRSVGPTHHQSEEVHDKKKGSLTRPLPFQGSASGDRAGLLPRDGTIL